MRPHSSQGGLKATATEKLWSTLLFRFLGRTWSADPRDPKHDLKFCVLNALSLSSSLCRDLKIENFLLDEHNNIKIVGMSARLSRLSCQTDRQPSSAAGAASTLQNICCCQNCDLLHRLWPEQHAEGRVSVPGAPQHPVRQSRLRGPRAVGSQEVRTQSGRLVCVSDLMTSFKSA